MAGFFGEKHQGVDAAGSWLALERRAGAAVRLGCENTGGNLRSRSVFCLRTAAQSTRVPERGGELARAAAVVVISSASFLSVHLLPTVRAARGG